ncbi:sugar ABC transporter substrate-binding protein [Nocardioides jensenii]|uniref:sugar ABC transporter substrate-binding protein n=1 Tax=Nocardioides jensenii TaxID=1843 RepID=UPI0009EA8C1F|nr:sugar ABC transporter substrate-binding protein [Nocardioides jensenii]
MRPTFLRRTRGALLAAFVAGTMMLSACSSSSGSNSNPDSKEIVAFMPSSANSYFVRYFDQAKAEAADHGYKIKIIENDFDQAEQDQQIQQFIASGERPAAVIFWPSTSEAAVNNARQLSRLAPVVQVGLQVLPEAEDYVAAFEGQDDVTVGEMAGGLALEAREEAIKQGNLDEGEPGNLIEFSFPENYSAGAARSSGFAEATKEAPFKVLRKEYAGFDATAGFESANSLIPRFKDDGIDVVYVHNAEMAVGVVRALEQNGLKPGKDVTVVVGDANGGKALISKGKIFGAVVQSPSIDAILAVRTAVRLHKHDGESSEGVERVEPTPELPEMPDAEPKSITLMPLLEVTPDNYESLKLWDLGFKDLIT